MRNGGSVVPRCLNRSPPAARKSIAKGNTAIARNLLRILRTEAVRLSWLTSPPFLRIKRRKLILRDNFKTASHGVVTRAAEFMAGNLELSRFGKGKGRFGNGAWNRPESIVRAQETEPVHRVRARNSKPYRNTGRDDNALRHEDILLCNHAHSERPFGIFGYPQIAFDEFSVQMERCGVGSVAASEGVPNRQVHHIKPCRQKRHGK